MLRDKAYVLAKLEWMRENRIWPNGLRYLWTDAFGVVLLVSLHVESGRDEYLSDAELVVAEVDRVLGRERGIRIGEEPDRDGQYFHYLPCGSMPCLCLGVTFPSIGKEASSSSGRFTMLFWCRDMASSGR